MTSPVSRSAAATRAVDVPPWRPTMAHLRAVLGSLVLLVGALAFARPDLLVLATPLGAVALWGTVIRPTGDPEPRVAARLVHEAVREGEATSWRVDVTTPVGAEQLTAALATEPWSRYRPDGGAIAVAVSSSPAPRGTVDVTAQIDVSSIRWGRRDVGPGLVALTSAWGAYRIGPVTFAPTPLATLPLPAIFDAAAPLPHPSGVVGLNRSMRSGDGTEFAGIRPFQHGDRLRRIHWPVSLRSGELHVAASYSDRDTEVALIIDATTDVGPSTGIHGAASSLDLTVRAAGALTEHFLQRGDRVGLSVMGAAVTSRVPARSGRRHMRRVLDRLASIDITPQRQAARWTALDLPVGAVAVMMSPLIAAAALEHAVVLARRGVTVIVIDTLPTDIVESGEDAYAGAAWRIRLLEREREQRRVVQLGVPVVQWRGPGSLDQVLRDITRRAAAPRMVRR